MLRYICPLCNNFLEKSIGLDNSEVFYCKNCGYAHVRKE